MTHDDAMLIAQAIYWSAFMISMFIFLAVYLIRIKLDDLFRERHTYTYGGQSIVYWDQF